MNIKARLALSIVMALITVVLTYLNTENISEHRNIISVLTVPAIAFFLARLILTSLFNTKNETTRKRHLFIMALVMITSKYVEYNNSQRATSVLDTANQSNILSILAIAYLATAGVALLFRTFTLMKERFFDTLPN